jgi:hypothetical protein
MLEKGKIYRIRRYAYENEFDVRVQADLLGWLWVWDGKVERSVIRDGKVTNLYVLQSVATGEERRFFADEVGVADA